MDIIVNNGVILPLFATWFFPVAIRDAKSGKFKGFLQVECVSTLLVLLALESIILVNEFGITALTGLRIVASVGLAFSMSLLFIKFTNKKQFDCAFEFVKSKD